MKPDVGAKEIVGIVCTKCGWVGVSWYRYDYKTCSCPNQTMIDGGFDYVRCGGKDLKKTQLVNIFLRKVIKPKRSKKK